MNMEPVVGRYAPPEMGDRAKRVQRLIKTESLMVNVQVVREGGETNLHSHPHLDGLWFVLRGRARFYTTKNVELCDLGPREAVLIPRGFPYWFESVEPGVTLEILQMESWDRRGPFEERDDLEAMTPATLLAKADQPS